MIFPVEQEVEEAKIEELDRSSLLPPVNGTDQERIDWLKKKLPNFNLFKSTRLSRQFDGRIREFFGHDR
ncbi:hypothetical protein, partial [Staphylococcus nepalensis]|uniref:hypothetical protein n=1 Tax=Staphylococcus nepalensis TaxID=214473 RepID=UPI00286DE74E